MKPWRVWLVVILASVIVLGHAYDIVAQTEHWPFSYYPMYGRLQPVRKLSLISFRAVMPEGKRLALREVTDPIYIPQLGETRLRNILMTTWSNPDRAQATQDMIAMMRDFLKIYEARRLKGLHDGPPIRELHLCRITWKLNDDGHAFPPKVQTLIIVRADGVVTQYPPSSASPESSTTQSSTTQSSATQSSTSTTTQPSGNREVGDD